MKLELKHIVGYLPYELKAMFSKRVYNVYGVDGDCIKIKNTWIKGNTTNSHDYTLSLKRVKPILRPMSDLHKDVNGKMAIKDLWEADLFGSDARDDEMPSYFMSEWTLAELMDSIPFAKYERLFDFLFQHHFDIHGLIEQGLAIDINTL